jgi:hypothetical protein
VIRLIVKCSHCHQLLSEEDFETHVCDLPLKGCNRIEVVYFRDDSYKDKKIMTGWGVDGTLYTFEVVPRKAIPMIQPLSDGRKHLKDSDGKVPVPKLRLEQAEA